MKLALRYLFLAGATSLVLLILGAFWLRWDAGRSLESWFDERRGPVTSVDVLETDESDTQTSGLLRIGTESGLAVTLRVIRQIGEDPLPVLLVLGGHRTGSDSANLFGEVGARAVVALDYPYSGPERVRGFLPTLKTIPLARQAFRDTPPAITLTLDWLLQQEWVDQDEIVIIGASLGVPFAAHAAAHDKRISGAILVHGAADNQAWLETQVARRTDSKVLRKPVATLIHWLAYGPTFATAVNVARISPRPVLIIGATHDERTPAGQTELLFDAAGDPKWLRWTDGAHIQPGRTSIVEDLLQIADEMLPFPEQD